MSQKVPIFTLMNSNDRDINRPVTVVNNQIVLKKERRFSKRKALVGAAAIIAILIFSTILMITRQPKEETNAARTVQTALNLYANWILYGEAKETDEVFLKPHNPYIEYKIGEMLSSSSYEEKEEYFQKTKEYFDNFMDLYSSQDSYDEILYGIMMDNKEILAYLSEKVYDDKWYDDENVDKYLRFISGQCWVYDNHINERAQ